jgi:hypothetical protein
MTSQTIKMSKTIWQFRWVRQVRNIRCKTIKANTIIKISKTNQKSKMIETSKQWVRQVKCKTSKQIVLNLSSILNIKMFLFFFENYFWFITFPTSNLSSLKN